MKRLSYTKGFTLVELLLSVLVISVIAVTVGTFQKDVFSLNYSLQGSLNAQLDARHVVKIMVTELRKASPSALGAYPVALASSTAITFYSDVDNNGVKDKVRYFVSGSTVRKGVVAPTGNPLVYNDANEKLTTIITGFVSSSTLPLFQYYPSSYTGTTSPLTLPIDVLALRLVKITVIIDKDPAHSPAMIVVTSQVNLRNLKDNL
jgi:prepilin-type N-terminal cleavage/methylation domain-containing protein